MIDLDALEALARLRKMVDKQAEDDGLWFIAQTGPEAYLQQELRKLHYAIEWACEQRERKER